MKDQILKIAKVKSEKEFYKKYPSEEAFMKAHGKAFKKAAMGSKMVNDQLHQLTDFGNPPIAQYGAQTPKFEFNKFGATADNPQGGFASGAGQAGMNALQSLDKIAGGIEAINQQKKAIKKADQSAQLGELALTAQQTMEIPKNQYVRPEDSLVQPGQLGNPYGTGTNYLQAQNGTMIGGNPTEIQNMYNPGDMYNDLGFEPLEETYKQYRRGGNLPKAEFGEYFQDSGQAQIGSVVGESIGSAFGPAGAAVGKFLGKVGGNLLGGAKDSRNLQAQKDKTALAQSQMGFEQARSQGPLNANLEHGGWVSNDWQPQTFTKFGEYSAKDLLKPPYDADMLRSGGHLAQVGYTAPSAEAMFTGRPDMPQAQLGLVMGSINKGMIDTVQNSEKANKLKQAISAGMMNYGGKMALGGELQIGEGGYAETLSYNPNLPGGEIGMFRGASHDNGGIQTQYGDNGVEVEGGEPFTILEDNGSEDGNNLEGGGSKENLVVFGNMKINKNIADLMGDPKAKGKKFKTYIADVAKNDAKQLKKINKGLELIENSNENNAFDHLSLNTGALMVKGAQSWQEINAEKIKQAGIVQDAIHQTAKHLGVKNDKLAEGKLEKETDPSMVAQDGTTLKSFLKTPYAERKRLAKELGYADYSGKDLAQQQKLYNLFKKNSGNSKVYTPPTPVNLVDKTGPNYNWMVNSTPFPRPLPQAADVSEEEFRPPSIEDMPGDPSPKKSSKLLNALKSTGNFLGKGFEKYGNTALSNLENFLRPSNANEDLPPDQLYPEYFALANNQLDPVRAQKFQPMLETPYNISLNDQLNAIDSQSRSIMRQVGNNPSVLANIAGQTLEAKNKVLGETNRINQANAMAAYDRNRNKLDDAQKLNLQILDNQYVRQAQAKSNTKAQTQAALSSIAAKTAQQRATNRKLAIMENMYGFRFSPSGRAINMNAPAQFDLSGAGSRRGGLSAAGLPANKRFTIDSVTGEPVGIRTLTKDEMAAGGPSMSELDSAFDNQKKGGKTPKTKARNSSIVKALKSL